MDANEFWPALTAFREARWEALRRKGRVVKMNNAFHLTHREDVVAALHNPAVFSSALRAQSLWRVDILGTGMAPIPTACDPPQHGRYRKILQPSFTPAAIAELASAMTDFAAELVKSVAATGGCDFVGAVAVPYAAQCLHTFCGLPPKDATMLSALKQAVLTESPDSRRGKVAGDRLFPYLMAAIRERRRNPGMPGVFARIAESDLSDREALSAVFTVLGGGGANEAVVAVFALAALAFSPELRQKLRAEPELTTTFVDEVLRLEPPVSTLGRTTKTRITVGDVTIPAGVNVTLCLGAINREAGKGSDPLVKHPHWTFGAGPHRCPAANLARTQITLLINEWLHRIPDFTIQPGFRPPIHDVVFEGGTYQLPSLPLRWQLRQPGRLNRDAQRLRWNTDERMLVTKAKQISSDH